MPLAATARRIVCGPAAPTCIVCGAPVRRRWWQRGPFAPLAVHTWVDQDACRARAELNDLARRIEEAGPHQAVAKYTRHGVPLPGSPIFIDGELVGRVGRTVDLAERSAILARYGTPSLLTWRDVPLSS